MLRVAKVSDTSRPLCRILLSRSRTAGSDALPNLQESELDAVDAAQRRSSSVWVDDCRGSLRCLAEPAGRFLRRRREKQKLFTSHAVASEVHPGAMPYAYCQNQVDVFGAGKPFEIPALDLKADSTAAQTVQHLRDTGVVLLRNAVSKDVCTDALLYVMSAAVDPGPDMTEEVQNAKYRHNLRLYPDSPSLRSALEGWTAAIFEPLAALVTSQAHLVEFGAYLTNPGARAQEFHTDTMPSDAPEVAPYYVTMLYLTDVLSDGGRFEAVPCSHALSPYRALLVGLFEKYLDAALVEVPEHRQADYRRDFHTAGLCMAGLRRDVAAKAGDVLMYDTSLIHRGSANQGGVTRGAMYMTFMGQGTDPGGLVISIHNELLKPPLGPMSLAQLQALSMQ